MNKFYTSSVVEKIGIKIPKSWVPGIPMPPKLLPAEGVEELEKSIIVKPNQGGSSIATSKVNTLEGMKMGIKSIEETMKSLSKEQKNLLEENSVQQFVRYFPDQTDSPIIQECIEGREFTVGVYRDYHGFDSLPIMEIKPLKQAFFDYEEKYESDGSNEVFLEGEEDIQKILRTESLLIAEFLDIRGVVRIDWRYDGKDFYFLEVNTIPGFTSASFIPKMWKKAGKTEKEFVEMMMI